MVNMMNPNYRRRIKIYDDNSMEQGFNKNCCDNQCLESRDGNLVCVNCGVIQDKVIVESERRAYTLEELEKRKCTEPRWRDFGPRTVFINHTTDFKGQVIDAKGKTLFSRLSKIQKSLVSSIERNYWEAKPKLNMLASKMNLPEFIKETAWRIYSLSAQKKLTMGRTIEGFVAASLYAAIRVHEFPALFEEVCDASMIPKRTVHKSLGMIIKEVLPEIGLRYKPITAEQLVFRFGNNLNMSMETQKLAIHILSDATKKGLQSIGKDPKGLAASVIYIAGKSTGDKRTQAEIAETAKITEVTLRSRIKEMKYKS